jgi:spermidine synthase
VARRWGSLLPCLAHLGVAGVRTALLYLTNILGSASGSILVGFVLMDRLGLMEIAGTLVVWGLACAVLLSAVTPLLRRAKHFRIGLAAGLAVVGPLALPLLTVDLHDH